MEGHDIRDEVARELKERLAKRLSENPFTPRKRIISPSFGLFDPDSSTLSDQSSSALLLTPAKRLSQANESPVGALENPKSSSIVHDRTPDLNNSSFLRAATLIPENCAVALTPDNVKLNSCQGTKSNSSRTIAMVATKPTEPPSVESEAKDSESEQSSNASVGKEGSGTLLHSDPNLNFEERIVPVPLEGRQSDMYYGYIAQNKDLLEKFLKDPRDHGILASVDAVVSRLRAIETHVDLVFAEAETSSMDESHSEAQIEFAVQFGIDNSAKFKFLHWLIHYLQDYSKHLVLVTKEAEDTLLNILEIFLQAESVNYRIPNMGRQADPARVQGKLTIDIVSADECPLIQTPNLAICLNGVQADCIRQKSGIGFVEGDVVPVLHLVAPRTIDHIEHYIPPSFSGRDRIHTIVASLAQMRSGLEMSSDGQGYSARETAELVGSWFLARNEEKRLDWPLSSIANFKETIDVQAQISRTSTATSPSERAKRPLDDGKLDSAKRRRCTPQQQAIQCSTTVNNGEIIRISDSIPGSSDDEAKLHEHLREAQEKYQKERAQRSLEAQRFHEQEVMWVKQQTTHETLMREHRVLLGQRKATDEQLEKLEESNERLRNKVLSQTKDHLRQVEQLEQQRAINLLSADEKTVTVTQLKKEVAAVQEGMQRASKRAHEAEAMLEYTKEQYRLAQDAAASAQATVERLTAENRKLKQAASGEAAKLKALHLDKQYENKSRQLRIVSAELGHVKRALSSKEDELARWKRNGGRGGVGTRAHSATPQPKTRSRAASPTAARLSNLRNG